MFESLRGRLSYANVVSTVCLVLVVGGTSAYAVTQLDANSVKSKHIVNGQVKAPDLAPAAAQAPVAFAKVDAGDSELADLDPTHTKGIEGFSHETGSFYCFDLKAEAKVGVASPTYDAGARFPRVQVPGNGFCPEGQRDASVVFASTLENSVDQGFSAVFVR
jgi:hypothetical protein